MEKLWGAFIKAPHNFSSKNDTAIDFMRTVRLKKSWAINFVMGGWMDGWMTCHFTSFSTVFQSYQDDRWVIMKGCVQWNPVYDGKDLRLRRGSNL